MIALSRSMIGMMAVALYLPVFSASVTIQQLPE
jgi:hypothetical protein